MLHELPLGAMRLFAALRVHQSDQALVNEGGCLSPVAACMDLCEWVSCWHSYSQAMVGCTLNAVRVLELPICSPRWSCPSRSLWGSCIIWARLFDGVTTKFGNVSTKVGQPRWQCLRYKRPWWNRPKRLVEVWALSYWSLNYYSTALESFLHWFK